MRKYFIFMLIAVLAILSFIIYRYTIQDKQSGENTTTIAEMTTAIDAPSKTTVPQTSVIAEKPEKELGEINSLIELLKLEYPDNTAAVLVNAPTDEMLKTIGEYGVFSQSDAEPPSLIIPIYIGTELVINQISEIKENGEVVFGDQLYTSSFIKDNYSLLIESVRAEGIPNFVLNLTCEEKTAAYFYAYNGKEGNEGIEYIPWTTP